MELESILALRKQVDTRLAALILDPMTSKIDMGTQTKVSVNQKH